MLACCCTTVGDPGKSAEVAASTGQDVTNSNVSILHKYYFSPEGFSLFELPTPYVKNPKIQLKYVTVNVETKGWTSCWVWVRLMAASHYSSSFFNMQSAPAGWK